MIFPWQKTQWEQLIYAQQKHKLPHALLLTGLKGLGKKHFAAIFARTLLCQAAKEFFPCEQCHSCHLARNDTHPNILWIESEKTGQQIKIDQIRAVNEFVQQTSLKGQYRIILIHPASQMNINAANALLKTLEEPAPYSILILITEALNRLPATIISRCQRMNFKPPVLPEAINWVQQKISKSKEEIALYLKLANGAPLTAIDLLSKEEKLRQIVYEALYDIAESKRNPLLIASELQDSAFQVIEFYLQYLLDLARAKMSEKLIMNSDFAPQLLQLATKLTALKPVSELLDYLVEIRRHVLNGIHLNKQLLLEDIFLRWLQLFSLNNFHRDLDYVFG